MDTRTFFDLYKIFLKNVQFHFLFFVLLFNIRTKLKFIHSNKKYEYS